MATCHPDRRYHAKGMCRYWGEVRGLLCSGCNTGIGMLQEDPLRLFASIEYLVVGEVQ